MANLAFYKQSEGLWMYRGLDGVEEYYPDGSCRIYFNGTKVSIKRIAEIHHFLQGIEVTNIEKSNTPNDFYTSKTEFLKVTASFLHLSTQKVDIEKINGRFAGTFFGDDFTTTHRIATVASKWSQGLPTFATYRTFVSTGYWQVEEDPNSSYKDGVCSFATGIAADGKTFVTTQQANRYQPGHLSYFGYTAAWRGVEEANGDFIALVGAFNRGADSQGVFNQVKDGIAWGFVRESGELKKVIRFYKNFEYRQELLDNGVVLGNELQIFEQLIGYYGIHPSFISIYSKEYNKIVYIDISQFNSFFTSIQDPNLALGVLLENQGNTTNIELLSGSVEFGNYTTKLFEGDSSGRNVPDQVKVTSLAVDPDATDGSGLVVCYTTTDYFQSILRSELSGETLHFFQSNIENQLINISATGDANKKVNVNIYLVPKADVVATFSNVLPYVSVLQKALPVDVVSIDFTRAQLIYTFPLVGSGVPPVDNVMLLETLKPKLRPDTVAVLSLEALAATTVTDLNVLLNTRDLF